MKCRYALLVVGLLLAITACGAQGTPPPASIEVQMSLHAEPEPPSVGESTLIIALEDSNGVPVDGAVLQVHANMDHEGMMPVEGRTNASAEGEYHVPLTWTMGGGWNITVTAQLPNNGGEVSESFDLFVEAVSSQSIIHQDSSQNDTP